MLQALNRFNGAKPGQIADATGIPRPSVYRLLKTLEDLDLVSKDHSSNRWRPTRRVKALSSGFRDEDWVCQVAVPHMIGLGREIVWPLDLTTYRNQTMEVRESTHQISPYSVHHGMVGKKLPFLETASGRVYLANLQEPDRAALLSVYAESTGQTPPFVMKDGELDAILRRVKTLGVGFRITDFTPETMSIAAPVWYEDKVFACLTVIWSANAFGLDKGIELFREKLLRTADTITRDLVGRLTPSEIAEFRAVG